MSSGSLLLLLGLLTLWAELTPSMARPDFCNLPVDLGGCKGYNPSFYYNPNLKRCIRFIFRGCGGNANRFRTMEECMSTCAE
uniref:Kunitz peptide n=1 Tax=Calliophis bivirgatus TaxID=8633 RepID=A0A898INQ0_CALBG|nr:kunitz peptide [Calliophis bivirgatus]